MLFTTISILYGSLSITLGSDARIALATLLAGVATLVSVNHVLVGDVKQFRLWFLSLLLGNFIQCIWLLSAKVPDIKVKKEAQQLAGFGTGSFEHPFSHMFEEFIADSTSPQRFLLPLSFSGISTMSSATN
jgi:hypothetical protein